MSVIKKYSVYGIWFVEVILLAYVIGKYWENHLFYALYSLGV